MWQICYHLERASARGYFSRLYNTYIPSPVEIARIQSTCVGTTIILDQTVIDVLVSEFPPSGCNEGLPALHVFQLEIHSWIFQYGPCEWPKTLFL